MPLPRLCTLLLSAALFTHAASAATIPAVAAALSSADSAALRVSNMDIARRYLEAINAWDFAAMRAMLASDVVFEMPFAPAGFERRIDGLEKVMAFLVQVPGVVVDGSENLHDIVIDTLSTNPNEIVAEYKSNMKLIPTGLGYTNEYVTRFSIRDGKITRFAEYYDAGRLVLALGGKIDLPVVVKPSR